MKKVIWGILIFSCTFSFYGCLNREKNLKKYDYIETNNEYKLTPYKIESERIVFRSNLNKGRGKDKEFKIGGDYFVPKVQDKEFDTQITISGEFFEYNFDKKSLSHINDRDIVSEPIMLGVYPDNNIKIPESVKEYHKENFKDIHTKERELVVEGSEGNMIAYTIEDSSHSTFSIIDTNKNKIYNGNYSNIKNTSNKLEVMKNFFMNPKTKEIYSVNNIGEIFECDLVKDRVQLNKVSQLEFYPNKELEVDYLEVREINGNILFIESLGEKLSVYDFDTNKANLVYETNKYSSIIVFEDYVWIREDFPGGSSNIYMLDIKGNKLELLLELKDIYILTGVKVLDNEVIVTSKYDKGELIKRYNFKSPFR